MTRGRAASPTTDTIPTHAVTARLPFASLARFSLAPRPWLEVSLVAGLLIYLALTPLAPFARAAATSELRRHLVLGAVIAGYLLLLAASRRLPVGTPLDLPILAVLVAVAAGVAGSIDQRGSAEWAMVLLPVAPLYYLFADHRLISARSIQTGVLVAGVVVATVALNSIWQQWWEWTMLARAVEGGLNAGDLLPPAVPRVQGAGSHPNVLASVLAIAAPLYLQAVVTARGRRRVAPAAALIWLLAALFFTLSRAGWLAAAAGLAVTATGLVVASGYRPRRTSWLLSLAVLAMVAGLAVSSVLGGARPDWLFRNSLDPRADMRRVGLEIFRDNPLTGAGPGQYVTLYPAHDGVYSFAAVHSHNVPVQIAADYGIAGLAAAALLLISLLLLLRRRFARGDRAARAAVSVTAGACAAFLVHGLADAPHLFPEVWLLLAAATGLTLRATPPAQTVNAGSGHGLPIGAVPLADSPAPIVSITPGQDAARPRSGPPSHRNREAARRHSAPDPVAPPADALTDAVDTRVQGRRRSLLGARPAAWLEPVIPALRRAPLVAVLIVAVALLPAWWYSDRAAASYHRAIDAALGARSDQAVAAAEQAAARDPRMAAYQFQVGLAYLSRYYAGWQIEDRAAAIAAFERGLTLQPGIAAAWVDLAALRLDADDTAGGWAALERLRPLAGRDTLLLLAYAALVQRAGTPEQAIDTYAGLLALNPSLALTPFWRTDDFRRANYDAIVDRAVVRAEEITGPGPAADSLRTTIRVLTGRGVTGERDLQAALAAAPDSAPVQAALGRLLTADGRYDQAEPLLRAAVRRTGDSADARAALGDLLAAKGDLAGARRQWLRAGYLGDVAAMDRLGQSFLPGKVPSPVIRRQRQLVEGAWISRFYLPFQTFRFTFLRHEPAPIIGPGDWLNALPDGYERWQEHLTGWGDRSPP